MPTYLAKRLMNFIKPISLIGAALIMITSTSNSYATPQEPSTDSSIYQLRIYEIFESNKEAFHQRFRDQAIPIMKRYGFNIVALWERNASARTEFVYLIRWPDQQTMQAAWEGFMADQEWAEIKERSHDKHGQMVGDIEEKVMHLTDYSAIPISQAQP